MTGLAGLEEALGEIETLAWDFFPDPDAAIADVAAAVTAWLAERLGEADVLEAVCEAIAEVTGNVDMGETEAALAAVVGALAGEGNADSAHEAARNGARSDERPERDQLRQGRDDEGRSGARDGSGDV